MKMRSTTTTPEYRVRLELLDERHAADLSRHGSDPSLWQHMAVSAFSDFISAREWVREARKAYEKGQRIPFAIVLADTGEAVGSSSFISLRREHKSVEIGWTWLGAAWQGSGINTEAKFLMLQHAFGALQANRVEFRTDERNLRSQRALEKIGATREGCLRAHTIMPDGFVRNTVYYSITWQEWPAVKALLLSRMAGAGESVSVVEAHEEFGREQESLPDVADAPEDLEQAA